MNKQSSPASPKVFTTDIGPGVSANAIRQRVAKLKNMSKQFVAGTDVDIKLNAGGTPTPTPKRTAAPKTKKNTSKTAHEDASDDDEAASPSPSKKQKTNGSTKSRKSQSNGAAKVSTLDEVIDEEADAIGKAEKDLGSDEHSRFKLEGFDEGDPGV